MIRRLIQRKSARRVAARLTAGVALLHAALLLALWLDPVDPPRAGNIAQLLWASARRPSFCLLALVIVAAPPLTLLAWPVRGGHRRWLVVSWLLFGALAGGYYAARLVVMSRILLEQR